MENNNELKHWGVPGMKWGVRRYQNADGTLTARGKKRYEKEMEKLKAEEKILKARARTQTKLNKIDTKRKELDDKRKQLDQDEEQHNSQFKRKKLFERKESDGEVKVKEPKKKGLEDMTDEELGNAIRRVQLENQYKSLTEKQKVKGEGFISKHIKPTVGEVGKTLAKDYLMKRGKELLGLEEEKSKKYETPDSLKALQDEVKKIKLEEQLSGFKQRSKDTSTSDSSSKSTSDSSSKSSTKDPAWVSWEKVYDPSESSGTYKSATSKTVYEAPPAQTWDRILALPMPKDYDEK